MVFTKRRMSFKPAGAARFFIAIASLLVLSAPAVGQTFTNGQYCTYTQGGWGAVPHGNNPAALLATNFDSVYPIGSYPYGLVIGYPVKFTMTFTSALAIQDYLPAGGKPKALTANYPTSTSSGVFGGQVLALELNVDFSEAGKTPKTLGIAFGDLVLSNVGSSFEGLTVADVLAAANQALGGGPLPSDYTISGLNDLVSSLNQGFDNCYSSGWAQEHLTPPSGAVTPPPPIL